MQNCKALGPCDHVQPAPGPVLFINSSNVTSPLSSFDMVVMLGFALCVLTEIVSDIQKLGCEFVGKFSPLVWQGTVYHQPLKESYVGEARPGWVYNRYEKIIQ